MLFKREYLILKILGRISIREILEMLRTARRKILNTTEDTLPPQCINIFADLRKRSGIASEYLFFPSHCSVVEIK